MQYTIRKVKPEDAVIIADLSVQLGYNPSAEDTASYIREISKNSNEVIYVAVSGPVVIGWMHVFITTRLESGIFAEIGGLVVHEHFRGKGIGKLLIEKAIEWSRNNKITTLRLRSNIKRHEAHQFYKRSGFVEVKEQKVFKMDI